MDLRTKITAAAVTLVAAGGLALAASPAHASVTGSTFTQDGMAGYFGNSLGTNYKSMISTFDLTSNAENIGVTSSLTNPQGALGQQLCANGSGNAAELGVVYNGLNANNVGTFTVAYALGKLPSAPNQDSCLNGILHNGNKLHSLLNNIPDGDTLTILEQTGKYGVWFSAQDNSTGRSFETWASCGGYWTHTWNWHNWRWHWYGCPKWNEPGAGVQQNLTNLGGSATGDLVDFSAVSVDKHETASPGTPLGSLNDITVNSSGTGNAPWLVGPAKTSGSPGTGPNGEACANLYGPLTSTQFSVCAATPTGA
jgi:hypothetical protein